MGDSRRWAVFTCGTHFDRLIVCGRRTYIRSRLKQCDSSHDCGTVVSFGGVVDGGEVEKM